MPRWAGARKQVLESCCDRPSPGPVVHHAASADPFRARQENGHRYLQRRRGTGQLVALLTSSSVWMAIRNPSGLKLSHVSFGGAHPRHWHERRS